MYYKCSGFGFLNILLFYKNIFLVSTKALNNIFKISFCRVLVVFNIFFLLIGNRKNFNCIMTSSERYLRSRDVLLLPLFILLPFPPTCCATKECSLLGEFQSFFNRIISTFYAVSSDLFIIKIYRIISND